MLCLFSILAAALLGSGEVRHFPSIVYGQILLGPGASRYETTFSVSAKKETPATLELFTDKGEPMQASFVDSSGAIAATDSSMRFLLTANRALTIKVQLTPEELKEDVALKTGWANFSSAEDLEVWATIRILKPDGTVIDKHILLAERVPHG